MTISVWFEKHFLFSRGMIFTQVMVNFWVTGLSFDYIMFATEKGVSGAEIVMVAGALQAPTALVLGYLFKLYTNYRRQTKNVGHDII